MIQHAEAPEVFINELLKVPKPNSEQDTYWFPTPEEPGDPAKYTPIQQRMYNEFLELKELEKLNPHDNEASRKEFQTSTGQTQHSAQTNRKELKKFLLNFRIFLPDTGLTLAKIVNSKSN